MKACRLAINLMGWQITDDCHYFGGRFRHCPPMETACAGLSGFSPVQATYLEIA